MLIDHISLAVSDLVRSTAFYQAALAPLGIAVGTRTAASTSFERDGQDDFSIHQADAAQLPLDPPPGSHFAFGAAARAAVEAFHAAALAAGGQDDGPPGLRPQYHAGYYAAFVLDPDRHRIEAVFHDR